jgi:hypothetical protein
MWADVRGGLASMGRSATSEASQILGELDRPSEAQPRILRRVWRGFRETPIGLQITAGVVFFLLWALLLVAAWVL